MRLTCFRITEDAYLESISPDSFVESWKQGAGQFWVDIEGYDREELKNWLTDLNISELAMQFSLNTRNISHVVPLEDAVLFEFPIYHPRLSDNMSHDNYISVLCLQNLMITISSLENVEAERLVKALMSELKLDKASISALVCILLAAESARVNRRVDEFREEVYKLDERMDRDPDSIDADDIRELKHRLREFDTVVYGQVVCFDLLKVLNTPFLNLAELTTYFQFATTNASAAFQSLSRLEKTLSDLSQRFDTNQQEKTNHRLAILTVLSAIFMPLTLIAGIYGMNFENMPELKYAWAYPAVLVLMNLIAFVMYRFFKTRGWLD